jgi:calcineurin-like phosphoesterase family protein
MGDQFHTSDQHFGHARIAEFSGRPFPHTPEGVLEMNEAIVDAWNAIVGPLDLVWVHGDVAMGTIVDSLGYIARLNGVLHLIRGNHDRCSSLYGHKNPAKVAEWTERYLDAGFASVVDTATLATDQVVAVTPNREGVLMTHFPYEGDSQETDRYSQARPRDEGGWLLHGHVHEAWRQRGRQINVGIDAWGGRPVSIDEITELIAAGPRDLAPLPWIATH